MKKHCTFPEIGQYRNIVRTITDRTRYVGKDEDGKAIYDNSKPLPCQIWTGTVKLHGTNSGITMNREGEMWAQSREHNITIEKDNAGFAWFVETKKDVFKEFFSQIDMKDFDYVTIFGEWCGTGIQKGVAIAQLPKMFVIFDIKLSYDNIEQGDNIYLDNDDIKKLKSAENQIYNIYDFKTYEMEIDFNEPAYAQNKLAELTLEVEAECPVGKAFDSIGVGEGIVWTYRNDDGSKYRFKVKGDKHSSSKVKKLASVDTEKLSSIKEFVEYAVTESRLTQAIEKVFGDGKPDIKRTGDFLRWIVNDVIKEELDTLAENGLEPKEVNSAISNKARNWLLEQINKF